MDTTRSGPILPVLFIGVLMGALDIAVIGPAFPAIKATFGTNERTLTWLLSIYVLMNLIGTPLMSRLSDLYGRRTIYIVSIALFAVGSLVVAASLSIGMAIGGRALQGFGAGGIFPVASAVIGDVFPEEKRGFALGVLGAFFGLAFVIGPVIGGVLLLVSWRLIFIVNIPIALVIIFWALEILPSVRAKGLKHFDWPGLLILILMVGSLAWGINRIDTGHLFQSIMSAQVFPYLAAPWALLPIFLEVESRRSYPLLPLRLFRSRQIVLAELLSFGTGIGEASLIFIPSLVVSHFAISSSRASFALLPPIVAMALGSLLAGKLVDVVGSKPVILSGTALWAIGMFSLGFTDAKWAAFLLSTILIGIGISAPLGAPLRYIMLNAAREEDRAIAQGMGSEFASMGQLLCSAFFGALLGSSTGGKSGYAVAYFIISLVVFGLVILSFFLKSAAEEKMAAFEDSDT